MTEREHFTAQREAIGDTVHHDGPTTNRYHTALERYLAAVAGEHSPSGSAYPSRTRSWTHNTVGDVMTENVIVVDENASFKQIVNTLARHQISAVPVVDGAGRVRGVVSASDLLAKVAAGGDAHPHIGDWPAGRKQARRKAHAETATDLMTTPAVTATPDDTVVDAARAAARAHVRRLPVVDDADHIVGIVARSDLLRVFLRSDEEIRDHLTGEVITRQMLLDPNTISVEVTDGVVTLSGEVEHRLLVAPLLDAARRVAGVVAVHDKLTYAVDDTVPPPPRFPLY